MSTNNETWNPPLALPATPLHGDSELSAEQIEELLTLAGKYRDDPGYVDRLMEGVREYGRRIQDEFERELAAVEEAEKNGLAESPRPSDTGAPDTPDAP